VVKTISEEGAVSRFIISPNCSLSRGQTRLFFAGISLFALLVALRFYLLGAWVVLPITALELLVLGVSLRMFMRNAGQVEVLTMDSQEVTLQRRGGSEEGEWRFQTYWLRVLLDKDNKSWYPSRLVLSSHGRAVEIGAFLTEEDREALAESIGQRLHDYNNPQPAQ